MTGSLIALDHRRAEVFRRYSLGETQAQLAVRFGVVQSTISDDIAIYRKSLPPVDRQTIVEEHRALFAWVKTELAKLAEMDGAPVTAGKDGLLVFDPSTNLVVRDYSLRTTALRDLVRTMEREAKMLGVDAPAKVDMTIKVEGTVDDEINRLTTQLGLVEGAPVVIPGASESADGRTSHV